MKYSFMEALIDIERVFSKIDMPYDENSSFRVFQAIPFDSHRRISIQASFGHYCTPRKTFEGENINRYDTMEIAILDDGELVNLATVLPHFSRIEEMQNCFDGAVYGYVPVDLIEDLYKEWIAERTYKPITEGDYDEKADDSKATEDI